MSETRWFARSESLEALWGYIPVVAGQLTELANSDTLDADTNSKLDGLLSAITRFEFIAELMFMRALLS